MYIQEDVLFGLGTIVAVYGFCPGLRTSRGGALKEPGLSIRNCEGFFNSKSTAEGRQWDSFRSCFFLL